MKTFSTINHETVRNHQTNNSPSKLAFKFSQSKRFKDPNPQCPKTFYQDFKNISQLSKRKTSFGFGDKYDFTKMITCSPPVTKYQLKSSVEQARLRGKSFGCARDKSPDRSYLVPQLQKVPGPGNYIEKDTMSRISFTMRPKTEDVIKKNFSYIKNPGPNVYQEVNLLPKTGRFVVSKFNDTKFAKINPNGERFQTIKSTPGPLDYKEKDTINGLGKYIVSKNKGDGTRAFAQTARFGNRGLWQVSENPGPGNYAQTSEFGAYGDSKYYKTLTSFKSTIN